MVRRERDRERKRVSSCKPSLAFAGAGLSIFFSPPHLFEPNPRGPCAEPKSNVLFREEIAEGRDGAVHVGRAMFIENGNEGDHEDVPIGVAVNTYRHIYIYIIFFRYLFPPAVSMWVSVHGAPASASTHGKAAAVGGHLPTRVGKEFVQGGLGHAIITLPAGGQLK